MSEEQLHETTEDSLAGDHARKSEWAFLVAPTEGKEVNTLRAALIPIACWRVEDLQFEFASSFVKPEITNELNALWSLREEHKKEAPPVSDGTVPVKKAALYPPLSLFGHADPVGEDEFNKKLSGRRVTAIYALMTRRTDLWEELYSQPLADDNWGEKAIRTIQQHLGMEVTGKADAVTRRTLFCVYMESLCTIRDEAGSPRRDEAGNTIVLLLDKEKDFLAQGKDSTGKGDYQGCGEFNPLLIFSQAEEQQFAAAQDKTARNRENAQNRRVMALLFWIGSQVEPKQWPCPRVKEGTNGCRKRFWSDGEKRRQPRTERREFLKTSDTFACRFYQRLTHRSPCEALVLTYRIRLFDPFNRLMAGAPFKLTVGQHVSTGITTGDPALNELSANQNTNDSNSENDEAGWAIVKGIQVPNMGFLEWGYPPQKGEAIEYVYSSLIRFDVDRDDDEAEAVRRRLFNLGYSVHQTLEENVIEFQRDYKLAETGKPQDIKEKLIAFHDEGKLPSLDPSGSDGKLRDQDTP